MSRLRLTQITTPAAPPASTGELFLSSSFSPAALAFEDASGNVARLAGLTTQDYRLIRVTTILQGTTTYTATAGTRALFIEGIGGGGGGGGVATAVTNSGAAGGGGAGGYSALWTTAAQKSPWTVQVGAGGAGGTAGANNGTGGTDTSFDTGPNLLLAKGGSGGIAHTVAAPPIVGGLGGAGGAGASGLGTVLGTGGPGSPGMALAAAQAVSGNGGDSTYGGGAVGLKTQSAGANAGLYGAGGSGGCILSGGASVAGGNGSNGILVIYEFA